jgi:predicted transcriptional regulator
VKEIAQEFELEDLIERLVFLEKIETGIQQADQGRVTSHEKLKEFRKKW